MFLGGQGSSGVEVGLQHRRLAPRASPKHLHVDVEDGGDLKLSAPLLWRKSPSELGEVPESVSSKTFETECVGYPQKVNLKR